MTFYQELQLSSVASKQLIKATEDKKERCRTSGVANILKLTPPRVVYETYLKYRGRDTSLSR